MAPDKATYLGHSTVVLDLGGVRLVTDPVLRGRVGHLVRHGPAPESAATADVDAVLVSHLHRDHADLRSLRRLGPDVRLLVPCGSGGFFRRRGLGAVTELAPGEQAAVGEVTVEAVEALHDGGRRRGARESDAIGFVVRGRHDVYFAGDTDLFDGMAGFARGVDLALLPIWGWGPSIGPGHLNPERAARAAALLEPRMVVPIHWGTLYPAGLARLRSGPLRGPGAEFAARMRELAPQVEVRLLAPGESASLA